MNYLPAVDFIYQDKAGYLKGKSDKLLSRTSNSLVGLHAAHNCLIVNTNEHLHIGYKPMTAVTIKSISRYSNISIVCMFSKMTESSVYHDDVPGTVRLV